MEWHGYIGLGQLPALSQGNWTTLLTNIRQQLVDVQYGESIQPAYISTYRASLDGTQYIAEANFDLAVLNTDTVKTWLAGVFSVSAANISISSSTPTFAILPSLVATFRYNSTDYFRLVLFGVSVSGGVCTWDESRIETLAYLDANHADWEAAA